MKITIEVKLVRPARKAGGDRYEGALPTGQRVQRETLVIYVPQEICREDGAPAPKISITFET